MNIRTATNAEIIQHNDFNLKYGWRVQYEHFVRETYNPRAKNGVSHRRYSRSKLYVIDGVPHVKYQGRMEPVVGLHFTTDNGTETVGCLKIKALSQ